MRAYRLLDWEQPGFAEVPVPEFGPGQALVRVAGVGLCHSDVLFLTAPVGLLPYDVPFTLGHEIAGWVDALGADVDGISVGDGVAVACMSPCWECRWCRQGADNYCVNTWTGRGFGADGGLTTHIVVDRREIVPLGDLDPHLAAPLTDAGATSYHAVQRVRPKLDAAAGVTHPTAVVIGVGGLGAYAVQWLKLQTQARVIAVEAREERFDIARKLGADEVIAAGDGLSRRLREVVGDDGADAVLDFVGTDQTLNAALRNAAKLGAIALVGQGFGKGEVRYGQPAHDCDIFNPQGSPIAELHEVIELARSGKVTIEVEQFAFDDVAEAYERLQAGTLNGRAVVTVDK
jgi:propanol-preferring alcohol dehydrogenase